MKIYFSPPLPSCANAWWPRMNSAWPIASRSCPAAGPVARDQTIIASNPLGQVPTFFTDDGQVLYDSRVICEYLNVLGGGALFPPKASRAGRR